MMLVEAVDNDTGAPLVGSLMPRLFTPPLVTGPPGPCGCGCALTPLTSYGFGADDFARDTLLAPLDPWQRFAAIHAGELLPDGRPRFRRVIIVVARQNGKTHLLVVLTLYWMFVEQQKTILGTSTTTKYAAEPWQKAFDLALATEDLEAEMPPGRMRGMRKKASEEQWRTVDGSRYLIVPSNEEGGRSLTLNRVVADELSRQFDYGAYAAAYYAMRAVDDAQYFGLSTPLDSRSVVFNDFRKLALGHIKDGAQERLGLFEWSAEDGADPLDPRAMAAANPNAGHRYRFEDLLDDAREAVTAGGEALIKFKTESMCITAKNADPAIDIAAWDGCAAEFDGFTDLRGRVALVLDVGKSGQHATVYAAAVQPDGRVRVGLVEEWTGDGCADQAMRALPAIRVRVRPRVIGRLPNGPGAAAGAAIPGVTIEEIRGDLPQVCMSFAELVEGRQVVHGPDPLLDGQVSAAEKLTNTSGSWVFSRKGGDCDALYAAAGAAHMARSLPPPPALKYRRPGQRRGEQAT